MTTRSLSLCGVAVFLVLATAGTARGQSGAEPRVPELFLNDQALAQSISVSERRVPIGELLEKLSLKLGANLEASDKLAPISGFPVSVSVREVRGWEVMDALVAAFSHPPDRWYWKKESRRGQRWYVLYNTLAPDVRRQMREEFIQAFLLDQRRKASGFFKVPADQRARLAATDPFLAALNFDPPRSSGLISILDRLTDEQLGSILHGESIRIPTSSLNTEQREYVSKELARRGVTDPVSELEFRRSTVDGTIEVQFGDVGGVGALGGIWSQKVLEQRASNGWVASGESHQVVDAPFPSPGVTPKKDDLPLAMAPHFLTIQTVATLGHLNVVLDASQEGSSGSPRPTVPTKLSEVIHELETFRRLIWKVHGRFLVFAPIDWERVDRSAVVPWRSLKRLRASANSRNGYLAPEDWFFMAEFSRPQLQYLETEFPDARQVARLQGVLRMVAALSDEERAAVARPGGAGWENWSGRTKQRILVTFPEEEAQRTRFYLSWQTDQKPAKVSVYVGIGEGAAPTLTFKPRVDPEVAPPIIPFSPPQ